MLRLLPSTRHAELQQSPTQVATIEFIGEENNPRKGLLCRPTIKAAEVREEESCLLRLSLYEYLHDGPDVLVRKDDRRLDRRLLDSLDLDP